MAATGAAGAAEGVVAADTYVTSSHPTVNYGTQTNLYVDSGTTTLVQFDLGALPASVIGSSISRAVLRLFVNRVNGSGPVSVSPITSAWNEYSVTYDSEPTMGSPVATFTPAVAFQFTTVDITSLVQGWVVTPSSNHGIALTSATANLVLDSKENDQTSHPPVLDISFTP